MIEKTNRKDFELKHGVKIVNKKYSFIMIVLGFLLKPFSPKFMTDFFTTYRLPFQKQGTIAYPDGLDPMDYMDVLEHELIHIKQQRTAWGLIKSALFVSIIPLPIIFSGRWFLEKYPYFLDIRKGLLTIDQVTDLLWGSYGWAWPKPLMRRYFKRRLEEYNIELEKRNAK